LPGRLQPKAVPVSGVQAVVRRGAELPAGSRDDLWRRDLRELLSARLSGVPTKWRGCQRVVDRIKHATPRARQTPVRLTAIATGYSASRVPQLLQNFPALTVW